MPVGGDLIDQIGQVRRLELLGQFDGIGATRVVGIDQQVAQGIDADEVEWSW